MIRDPRDPHLHDRADADARAEAREAVEAAKDRTMGSVEREPDATAHAPPSPPEGRESGLGASELPAVLGLSPFAGPFDIWLLKTGKASPAPDNRYTKAGRKLEPVIAEMYAEEMREQGAPLFRLEAGGTVRHPSEPWLFASPDRLVVPVWSGGAGFDFKTACLLEIKNVSGYKADAWGQPWTDEVPFGVLAQVHQQMACTGAGRCHVAALLGGNDLRIYDVPFDAGLWAVLLEEARAFWKHVVGYDPPPLDGSTGAWRMLRATHPRGDGVLLPATPHVEGLVRQYREAGTRIAIAKRERDRMCQELCGLVGDHDGFEGGEEGDRWRFYWRLRREVQVDAHVRKACRVAKLVPLGKKRRGKEEK